MERIADYVVREVCKAGAKHFFFISGRGILYLTDAMAKNKDIIPVCAYHEQGASYAALAYASVNNRPSCCLVSTGCASANAVTAALCAFQDNVPVVFLSGNHILEETTRYTGVNIRTYGSQETDIIRIVSPITKYAVMITDADSAVYEVEKALYLAEEGRKGPVWIDIPLDVQNMRVDVEKARHFSYPGKSDKLLRTNTVFEQAKEVADEISRARRPVLLIGGGTVSAEAGDEVEKLVDACSIPVVFTPKAADIYGTSNALSIGAMGSIGGSRAGNFTVQNSDYLLAVGTKLCSQATGRKEYFARKAKITVVDIDEKEHTKNGVRPDRIINGDARDFLKALNEIGISAVSSDWIHSCKHWKELFTVENEAFVKELKSSDMLDIYSIAFLLNDFLPEDATVITDAGFEELVVPSTIRFRQGQRCLFSSSQGAMGYAIPAILGAFYAGRKNIIVIVGDGSFVMNMQEMMAIKAAGLPVKIIVINNGMYAVIRKRQRNLFRNRIVGTDPENGVPAPDLKGIAGAFGFDYRFIDKRSSLIREAGEIFCRDDKTILIEIKSAEDQAYFHESVAIDENRRLVHRPIEDMAPFLDRELFRAEMIIETVS